MKNYLPRHVYDLGSRIVATFAGIIVIATGTSTAEPLVDYWQTSTSGQYARVYTNNADKPTVGNPSGTPHTTWLRASGPGQTNVTYSGVQSVRVSTSYVYVQSSGLASHIMGPWYNANGTVFVNWPSKQNTLARFPRVPQSTGTKTLTGLGSIGMWVNGVAVFNMLDGFVWNGSADASVMGGAGTWQRDAKFGEGATFDAALAHQPGNGQYHHHTSPAGLRYQLGDNINYDYLTHSYSEVTSNFHHSPILGWAYDGYPIYGPYGYSDPTNSASAIRRMTTGFVLRNGSNSTVNLASTGRTSLPKWAIDAGYTLTLNGPPVDGTYPVGRYIQDYDHLGDVTNSMTGLPYQQGVDFDLDRFNMRFCKTPEFPNGTNVYFVTINTDGTMAYPYILGRQYFGVKDGGTYGSPPGGSFTVLQSPTTNIFVGGTNTDWNIRSVGFSNSSGVVTLTWRAVEGGHYRVESTDTFASWTTNLANVTATNIVTTTNLPTTDNARFYRVVRTTMDAFDAVSTP